MNHGVGGGAVQAGAAGLEADEKQRHLAGLETIDGGGAVAGVAGELDLFLSLA